MDQTHNFNHFDKEIRTKDFRGQVKVYRSFLPEGNTIEMEEQDQNYAPFQFIQHVTPLMSARSIIRTHLTANIITDHGVASKNHPDYHPAKDVQVVWFGPRLNGPMPEIGPALGNVVFNVPAKLLENLLKSGVYQCYWIENFQFGTILACRLLVTRKVFPGLKSYCPFTTANGPWRITLEGQHFAQKEFDNRRLDLELLLDFPEDLLINLKQDWTITVRWPLESNNAKQKSLVFFEEDDQDRIAMFWLAKILAKCDNEQRAAIELREADKCFPGGIVFYSTQYEDQAPAHLQNVDQRIRQKIQKFEFSQGWVYRKTGMDSMTDFYKELVAFYGENLSEVDRENPYFKRRFLFILLETYFHICGNDEILICLRIKEKGICRNSL